LYVSELDYILPETFIILPIKALITISFTTVPSRQCRVCCPAGWAAVLRLSLPDPQENGMENRGRTREPGGVSLHIRRRWLCKRLHPSHWVKSPSTGMQMLPPQQVNK